jgi:tetratricopeptide (TPR) repeat protein
LFYAEKCLQSAEKQPYKLGIANAYKFKALGHHYLNQYLQAMTNYETALTRFKELGNLREQSQILNNLALISQDQGNTAKALQIHQESLQIKERLKDNIGIANSYSNIGNLYDIQGNYDQALTYHYKALKIRENLQNQAGMAISYTNLGNIYNTLKQLEKAIENYRQALRLNDPAKNPRQRASILGNLGSAYFQLDSLDKALQMHQEALLLNRQLKDKTGETNNLNDIGLIYAKRQQFDQAQTYFSQGLTLIESIGNKEKTCIALSNLATNLRKQKSLDQAYQYAEKSYHLAKSIPSKLQVRQALKTMADIKYDQKDGLKAYQLKEEALVYHDSIFNEASIKQINELQTKYETEKKEKEIELLSKQQKINELALNEQRLFGQQKQAELALLAKEKEVQSIEYEKKQIAKETEINQLAQAQKLQQLAFDKKEKERLANIQLLQKENALKATIIDNEKLKARNFFLFTGIGVLLLVAFFGVLFLRQRQHLHLETERRLRGNIIHQFETLKNQISPHFLLNSLSALNSLIGKNPEKAQTFTTEMTKVYRYVLELKDNLLVQLKEELELSKAYISLQKMRFGENLQISLSISTDRLEDSVPPLSLQLLLENAIKHNEVDAENPLQIDIQDEAEYLIVRNNLQQRPASEIETSTHIGLKNLKERYRLAGGKEPVFVMTNQEYIVKLPLV